MSVRSSIIGGIVAAGIVLAVPVAAWAQADDYTREPTEVSGETFSRPDRPTGERPTRVAGTTVSRDPGSLAVTGGDVLGLAALGAGAIGVGTVLVRRGRTRAVTS